jgi:predicted PurR-regulated permease PerM
MALPFIVDLVLAGVFAVVFWPLREWCAKHFWGNAGLSAGITATVVLIIVFVPLNFFGIRIILEASSLYSHLMDNRDAVQEFVIATTERFGGGIDLPLAGIGEYAAQGLRWLVSKTGAFFSELASVLFHFALWIVALYYFLKDGGRIVRYIRELAAFSPEDDVKFFGRLEAAVRSIVLGSLAIAILQGFLTGVGLAIFGVPNPVLWGFFAVIAALVPGVGAMIVTVPASVYALVTHDGLWAPLGLLLWGILIVGTADNIVRPFILRRGVNVHQFLVLLSVLGGIAAFGPMGFLLGPLVLSLLFALLDVYPRTATGQ